MEKFTKPELLEFLCEDQAVVLAASPEPDDGNAPGTSSGENVGNGTIPIP